MVSFVLSMSRGNRGVTPQLIINQTAPVAYITLSALQVLKWISCVYKVCDQTVTVLLLLTSCFMRAINTAAGLFSVLVLALVCQGGATGFSSWNVSLLQSELSCFEGMEEQNKMLSRPIFRRDVSWEPFPNWTQPSRIFAQDFGLPPFLEPSDLDWLDWAKRRLASFSWPGFTQSPLLPPFVGDPKDLRQLTRGVSEVQTGQNTWKVNLDVNHFSPEEIAITTKEGYLQISGSDWKVENSKKQRALHFVSFTCFSVAVVKESTKKSGTCMDLFQDASLVNTSMLFWDSNSQCFQWQKYYRFKQQIHKWCVGIFFRCLKTSREVVETLLHVTVKPCSLFKGCHRGWICSRSAPPCQEEYCQSRPRFLGCPSATRVMRSSYRFWSNRHKMARSEQREQKTWQPKLRTDKERNTDRCTVELQVDNKTLKNVTNTFYIWISFWMLNPTLKIPLTFYCYFAHCC